MSTPLRLVIALLAAACTPTFDNVRACEDFLATMHCGPFDFATLVDCQSQGDTTCDRSGYFACLAEHTTCDDGTPFLTDVDECDALASCDD